MNRAFFVLAILFAAACATHKPIEPATTPAPSSVTSPTAAATTPVAASTSADHDPEVSKFLRVQDRLNVFASQRYIAHVNAAKAAGSDATQNSCMDSTVELGADIKAKPLLVIASPDLGSVDRSCGWCVLAAQRKAAAQAQNRPPLLAQLADARMRVFALTRKTLVACAPLREDMRLQALTPEGAVADLLTILDMLNGGGQ